MWAIIMTTIVISGSSSSVSTMQLGFTYPTLEGCRVVAEPMNSSTTVGNTRVLRYGDCVRVK